MPALRPYKNGILLATGHKLLLFPSNGGETKEHVSIKEIVCVAVSKATGQIAMASADKSVVFFDDQLAVKKQLKVNRNVSQLHFHNELLLVADKAGDVFCYDLTKDNKSNLILGHNSMILDITTSQCGNYVITCDRDEKIRVSHFPNSYNIHTFCLGHTEFVTRVKILKNDILVSTSGDGTVRFWNYLEGKLLLTLNTSALVNSNDVEEFFKGLEDVTMGENLPVTNLDVFETENATYFAISLSKNVKKLYLYKFTQENCSYEMLTCINACPSYFCFYQGNLLYVENSKICTFTLPDEKNLPQEFLDCINSKCNSLNLDNIVVNDNIQRLYKRTFDNLKEYHENKKQRMNSE